MKIFYALMLLVLVNACAPRKEPPEHLRSFFSHEQEQGAATTVAAPAHAAHPVVAQPQDSSTAMSILNALREGNARYVAGKLSHPNATPQKRTELTSGQAPGAIVLSCSDSRVPPEILFDKGLGEIFVVRTAGEVADPIALGSIEYAIEHLHSKLILVMGHSSCGAVKAALTTPVGKSAGSPSLDALVAHIRPAVQTYKLAPTDSQFIEPVRSNVKTVAAGLSQRSKIIEHAIAHEGVMVVEALYHLDTGKVDFWF